MTIEPGESMLRCLEKGTAAAPTYPEYGLQRRMAAIVRLRLTFTSPERPPKTEVFFTNDGNEMFTEHVRAYVRAYRLPCLPEGRQLVATQEFTFTPFDSRKVFYGEVLDEADATPTKVGCVSNDVGRLQYRRTGNVILAIKSISMDREPEVRVLHSTGPSSVVDQAVEFGKTFRLTCPDEALSKATLRQMIQFRDAADTAYVLRDLDLLQLIRVSKNWRDKPVYFDLNTMGCPFDLHLTVYQPYDENVVGEVEKPDPNRRAFIQWLKTLSYDFPPRVMPDILGSSTRIRVPCTVLDLTG